jgi:outer membrane protein assembly factor BamA
VYLQLEGDWFPVTWAGAGGPSGSVEGSLATYLSPPQAPDRVTLALRAGGRRVWGDFPYFESAFLGGRRSLRGYSSDRFAGDRSVFGNSEVRVKLADSRVLLPTEVGVLGLADVGRVWFRDLPGQWRSNFGGGIWISALERTQGLAFGLARGDDGTRFWFSVGKTF